MLREERAQARQFGRKARKTCPILLTDGQLHQLQVEILQVGNQVQSVVQVSLLLLALLAQKVAQLHIPQKDSLLLFGCGIALGNQRCPDSLGAELQGTQQIFELPQVEYIFGDILATTTLSYIHCSKRCLIRFAQK